MEIEEVISTMDSFALEVVRKIDKLDDLKSIKEKFQIASEMFVSLIESREDELIYKKETKWKKEDVMDLLHQMKEDFPNMFQEMIESKGFGYHSGDNLKFLKSLVCKSSDIDQFIYDWMVFQSEIYPEETEEFMNERFLLFFDEFTDENGKTYYERSNGRPFKKGGKLC